MFLINFFANFSYKCVLPGGGGAKNRPRGCYVSRIDYFGNLNEICIVDVDKFPDFLFCFNYLIDNLRTVIFGKMAVSTFCLDL